MTSDADPFDPGLLPLLLALPRGSIVGVLVDSSSLPTDLEAFGPVYRTEAELRHAVRSVPSRLVLDIRRLGASLLGAALPEFSRVGTIVALFSSDCGMLATWAARVLRQDRNGIVWETSESILAARCLELRVDPEPEAGGGWLRVPLSAEVGAETILSAALARGMRIGESRIVYGTSLPR